MDNHRSRRFFFVPGEGIGLLESYREQFQRVAAFWEDLCRNNQEHVAVVAHAGVIRALLAYLLDIPLRKSLYVGIDYGSVTKIHLIEEIPIIDYINR